MESWAQTQAAIFQALSQSTPVEYTQKYLLTMHDTTGLPWWATIVCSTVLLRTCITVPFTLYQHYILAKVENVNVELRELAKELKHETDVAVKMFNWDDKTANRMFKVSPWQVRRWIARAQEIGERPLKTTRPGRPRVTTLEEDQQIENFSRANHFTNSIRIREELQLRKQYNNLIERDNCHPLKSILLVFFQIPLWVSVSISLRNLVYMLPKQDLDAEITFTELSVGGFAWIPNLTAVDSSLILPVTFGLINLLIIELQTLSRVRVPTRLQKGITHFVRGISIAMVPIAASVPSCLVVYWTTSSAYGLVQNLVLMSPRIKRACRIPETPSEVKKPYTQILLNFKSKLGILK